jgi:hypothetical protein
MIFSERSKPTPEPGGTGGGAKGPPKRGTGGVPPELPPEGGGPGGAPEGVPEGAETPSDTGKSRQRNVKRREYMGQNPNKSSTTYRDVIDRMRQEGKIVGEGEDAKVLTSSGEWIMLKDAELSHTMDAVKWWNETGRFTGVKSQKVREFMTNPDNYILDKPGPNRSAGGKIKEGYLPPEPPSPPAPPPGNSPRPGSP